MMKSTMMTVTEKEGIGEAMVLTEKIGTDCGIPFSAAILASIWLT